ncbi:MAG: dihydrolipoyl dehydrogenase family protein [Anaerolineae bacterium]
METDRIQMDAIVIGSGQGGVPLATYLAGQGRRVALFERGTWGGSCSNYGCTPSKAFLASAHAAAAARNAARLGVHAEVRIDSAQVMQRVRELVSSWSQGVQRRLEKAGVQIHATEAHFVAPRTVSDGQVVVEAPLVVINTGLSPSVPAIEGLHETPFCTYIDFWSLEQLPPRAIVLGAGYTGVELGQGLARLGCATHLIDHGDRPLSHEEVDVSHAMGKALRDDGVRFHLSATIRRVSHDGAAFHLELADGEQIEAELLLLAAGQRPDTTRLNAVAGEVDLDDKGYIRVDAHLRTSCAGVYALGDVTGRPAFTHVSWEDYRRVLANIGGGARTGDDRVLGYGYFTEPQVGRCGLTADQAKAQDRAVRVVTLPVERVARAIETGRTEGFYRLVVDRETDKILGATLVGAEAAELVHVIMDLMETGATWQTLEQAQHIHPTFAEGLASMARLLKTE